MIRMSEPLSVSFVNPKTGISTPIDIKSVEVDLSTGKDYTSVNIFKMGASGTLDLVKVNKYEMYKMLHRADRSNKKFEGLYKYYKRCRNRNKLYNNKK